MTTNKEHEMPRKPVTKPEPEVTEDEVEDLDVEETTEDEADEVEVEDTDTDEDADDLEVEDEPEDEPAPAKKTRAKKTEDGEEKPAKPPVEKIEFGSAWLAEYVNEQCGTSYNAFGIRTLLRKLVKDGVVQRDVGTDRSRYNFTAGGKDATVRAVVKAIKSGEADAAKKAKIAEAQKAAAAKTEATETPAPKKTRAAKAKPAPEPEVEDDDEDEIDDL